MWALEDITFDLDVDQSEGAIWTVVFTVPSSTITVMGEVVEVGRALTATGVHIQSSSGMAILTHSRMALIAQRVMEEMGYERIVIVGAVRTSRARKGIRPRIFRFP